jgi:origin recognition complex subunit 1
MSPEKFLAKYPTGKIPRNSRDYGKAFICRRGCNTRTATYTDEFIWEDIYRGEEDIFNLVERVKTETKATRKRRNERHAADAEAEFVAQKDQQVTVETPKKKRKTSAISTPQKLRTPSKLLTPSHKRYVRSLYPC